MPTIALIANNPKGRFKGNELRKMLAEVDVVMGFGSLSWYQNGMPLNLWFVRHTRNNYSGFDKGYRAFKPEAVAGCQLIYFLNKNPGAAKKILRQNWGVEIGNGRSVSKGGVAGNRKSSIEYKMIRRMEWMKDKYKLRKKPSTGIFGLDYVLENYSGWNIKMINYTFKGGPQHDWKGERAACQRMVKKGKLEILA